MLDEGNWKVIREPYELAANLLIELTKPIGYVIADKNRKWICAFRNNSIAHVKIGDMREADVKEDLEKVKDLGNVLKTKKACIKHYHNVILFFPELRK